MTKWGTEFVGGLAGSAVAMQTVGAMVAPLCALGPFGVGKYSIVILLCLIYLSTPKILQSMSIQIFI